LVVGNARQGALLSLPGENMDNKLERPEPLVVDIPVAGAMAGMSPARSYAAVRDGFMPIVRISKDRMKVPLKRWTAILNGEVSS
jgi:hypothetical protein